MAYNALGYAGVVFYMFWRADFRRKHPIIFYLVLFTVILAFVEFIALIFFNFSVINMAWNIIWSVIQKLLV